MNIISSTRLFSSNTSNSIKKSSKLIRNEFLDYFQENLGHTFIRSSPVAPLNDNSIAFVNAGMNQFKGIFLNYYDPPAMKVTNSQKCIRISGKHNDLSIVGNDTYHHTFFEMLGNWSFGDYFKKEACVYAWDLLTKHYGIEENSLYVTYFGGSEQLGLEPDLECKDIWLNIGVAKDRVLPFGTQDNFWEMGIHGPCGPCTEIHIDHKKRVLNQSIRVNKGYSDLTELWNIVFIQYERLTDGTLIPLPKNHVDTGMGFERLVALLQEKNSNYDTDLFQPLFKSIEICTKAPAYTGLFSDDYSGLDSGYRILADHSRMIIVALADGIMPEENKKLRKIIRKAIDTGEKIFKKEKILSELSYVVAENLGHVYPELQTNLKKVQKILEFEEEIFENLRKTSGKKWKKIVEMRPELALVTDWTASGLLNGYKYLQSIVKDLKASKTLPGNVAFKLYDTYGLNDETITELAEIESLHFDKENFQNELQNVKYQSKLGLKRSSNVDVQKFIKLLQQNYVSKIDDTFKYEYTFVKNNYQFPTIESKIIGMIVNGNLILNNKNNITLKDIELNEEDIIGIILDKTLCYSFEGGQVTDCGTICINDLIFHINNVQKIDNYIIHFGKFSKLIKNLNNEIKIGGNCTVSINSNRRKGLMQHHTAAHLLNAFLSQILQVVYLRNSLILPNSLKLQFHSFGEKLSLEQLKEIEIFMNNIIKANVLIKTKILNSSELLAENCITLTPGSIYPYTNIRVVEINTSNIRSKEACCGTHVHSTGILEHFCLIDYDSKGIATINIKGVVGSFARSIRTASENVQKKILDLEHKLKNGKIEYEMFKSISDKIKNEINNVSKDMPIPYLVKIECLKQLADLDKVAWIQAKEAEMSALTLDIKSTDSDSYIVHCLQQNPSYLSLHEIISSYSNIPILIILYHNETIKARCFVPQEIVCDTFNAQTWMKVVLKIFNTEYGSIKGCNPLLVASMKSTNVSKISSESLILSAVTAAKNFAFTNIKKI